MANSSTNYNSLSVTGFPALKYTAVTGLAGHTNLYPDAGDAGVVIPLRLTSYTPVTNKPQVNVISTIPIVNVVTGEAFGGNAVSHGARGLHKIEMEGIIENPTVILNKQFAVAGLNNAYYQVPATTLTSGSTTVRVHYAEIITALFEGRMNVGDIPLGAGVRLKGAWQSVKPAWFRDASGKVFNNPRILDFKASYVEQAPNRTTFNMTLQVTPYVY